MDTRGSPDQHAWAEGAVRPKRLKLSRTQTIAGRTIALMRSLALHRGGETERDPTV